MSHPTPQPDSQPEERREQFESFDPDDSGRVGDDAADATDQTLDRLIGEALNVPNDRLAVERLQRTWIRKRRRRRRRYTAGLATAASLLLLLSWVAVDDPDPVASNPVDSPDRPTDQFASARVPAELPLNPPDSTPSPIVAREPTAYERMIFAARSRLPSPASQSTLVNGDVAAFVDRLLVDSGDALMARVQNSSDLRSEVVWELLQRMGDAQTDDNLPQLLEEIVGIDQFTRLILTSQATVVRTRLIEHLLASDAPAATEASQELSNDRSTSRLVASTIAQADALSDELLLALLDHTSKPVRVAAALRLGHECSAEVTRALIERVATEPADSPGAWMALLASSDATAQDFLNYAERQPRLLGYYNYARVEAVQRNP